MAQLVNDFAHHLHPAGVGFELSADQSQNRGFSAAAATQDGNDLPARNGHGDSIQDHARAVAKTHAVYFYDIIYDLVLLHSCWHATWFALKVRRILIQCGTPAGFPYAGCIGKKIPALFAPIMEAHISLSPVTPPALRFRNTSRRFGAQQAVEDVSFDVLPGECFGLVGGNGAGKTTLLKCMLDFIPAHAGSIEIFGVPYGETRARAKIAFLPERFVPPYYLTGEDFLRYMLTLHGRPYDASAIGTTFADLDLDTGALRKPVRTYSKGMTQKLGLAMCLLSEKELLVFDEPTTGLDPKARALFKTQIRLAVARGRSVLLTSHSLADVEEMCQRMAVLHEGHLLFLGSPPALREQFAARTLEAAYLACISERRN